MMPFRLLFPEVAERETRAITVYRALPKRDPRHVPRDEYGFDELYCIEPHCDCRRVMINVYARHACRHVATISHAFDRPAQDDPLPVQTFLDPLNRQSKIAPGLLDLFMRMVQTDHAYVQRLMQHYRLFKEVVNDPAHPIHGLLRHIGEADDEPPQRHRSKRALRRVNRPRRQR